MRPSVTPDHYQCELSYNKTWAWLQFKVYQMDFAKMKKIIDDIKVDFTLPLPFNDIDESKCYFKTNQNSNRVQGCVMLQIELTESQYEKLKTDYPQEDLDNKN